jgi:hypothetical protein
MEKRIAWYGYVARTSPCSKIDQLPSPVDNAWLRQLHAYRLANVHSNARAQMKLEVASMVHLRSIIFASVLAVANGPIPAQGQNIGENKQVPQSLDEPFGVTPRENPEVRSLLNDSEALPPEFASDVSLTLLENGFVMQRESPVQKDGTGRALG